MPTSGPVRQESAARLAVEWMGVAAAAGVARPKPSRFAQAGASRSLPALVVVALVVGAASFVAQEPPATPASGVPHSGSLEPGQVVRNVKALLRRGSLLKFSGIPELATEDLRARRILDVTSALIPPGYLVVELDDARGQRVANLAMTPDGHFIMLEDARGAQAPRPLPLADAASRVRGRRGRAPLSTRYVYLHNIAERGVSLCRPLVAAATEKGEIYLNSVGEAFIEEGTPLESEFQTTRMIEPVLPIPPTQQQTHASGSVKRLLSAGRW